MPRIIPKVKIIWPDGSIEFRSYPSFRGLRKEIDGRAVGPLLMTCDIDFDEIGDLVEQHNLRECFQKFGIYVPAGRVAIRAGQVQVKQAKAIEFELRVSADTEKDLLLAIKEVIQGLAAFPNRNRFGAAGERGYGYRYSVDLDSVPEIPPSFEY